MIANYVPALLKGEEDPVAKIKVLSERRCRHVESICEICAFMWSRDYELFWDRTKAGRELKERVDRMKAVTSSAE